MRPTAGTRFCIALLCSIAACFILAENAQAEYLFLKTGAILKGTVLEENTTGYLFKLEKDGTSRTYGTNEVMRVLYTEIYMGQQYVRLTDGKVLQAYVVDENRTSFTLRLDINKPAEIVVPREKVLFIARKNPNELEGTADFNSIDVRWKPPLGTIKEYYIYIKKELEAYPPKPVVTTRLTGCTVSRLDSSTVYNAIVTAVDEQGQESLPSNEITVMTKNYPPEAPGRPVLVEVSTWREGKLKASIEWERAPDKDGTIKEYRVETRGPKAKEFTPAGTVKTTPEQAKAEKISYELTGLEDNTEYLVRVRGLDNGEALSPLSNELKFNTKNLPPTPVEGLAGTRAKNARGSADDITITWRPSSDPGGKIGEYRVYEKTAGGRTLSAKTAETKCVLKNVPLDKRSEYEVCAVDTRGLESAPRTVPPIAADNLPPEQPYRVVLREIQQKGETVKTIEVSWEQAKDPDGTVVRYRVYLKTGTTITSEGETAQTGYTLKGLESGKQYTVIITSVDDKGAESKNKPEVTAPPVAPKLEPKKPEEIGKGTDLVLAGSLLIPLRDFGDLYGIGGGGTLSVRCDRLTKTGFTIGGDLGFGYLTGNHPAEENGMLLPLYLTFGYRFRVAKFLSIMPEIGIGGACLFSRMNARLARQYGLKETKTIFDPAFSCGVRLDLPLPRRAVVSVGCAYQGLIEKKGIMDFIVVHAGAGYRL